MSGYEELSILSQSSATYMEPVALKGGGIVQKPSYGNNGVYKDLHIVAQQAYEIGKSYYVNVSIPQRYGVDTEILVKLVNDNGSYQLIDTIHIDAVENSANKTVALYSYLAQNSDDDGSAAEAMVGFINSLPSSSYTPNALYKNNNGTYYIATSSTSLVETRLVNTAMMNAYWEGVGSDPIVINKEMVFSPLLDGCQDIVFEIVRNNNDTTIRTSYDGDDSDNGYQLGRMVVPDYYDVERLSELCEDGPWQKINIIASPGNIFCINGHNITIGPRGYYVQDIVPTTSLGVVPLMNQNDELSFFQIVYKKAR